jgi:hypothetical protein
MLPTLRVDLSTVSLIFATIWLLGSVSSFTMGGFIHLFLIAAIGIMLPRLIWGRKAAS